MKKTISTIKFAGCWVLAFMLLALGSSNTSGQIIPSGKTINWTHAGVRGGIIARPNSINVTQSPYNADDTGVADATPAIQAAINAATSNSVIYFPDGTYRINGSINFTKSYVTLRGDTNSVWMLYNAAYYPLDFGFQNNVQITDHIYSGATSGSTNIALTASPTFSVGSIIGISENDATVGTTNMPIINVHQYPYNIMQQVVVTSISGTNITISDPCMWNFTNGPVIFTESGTVTHGSGIENIIFNATNSTSIFDIFVFDTYDCWITNCSIYSSYNYAIDFCFNSHDTFFQNQIQFSQGSGSDHGGLLTQDTSESLFANNIFANGLQPAIEPDAGTTADAFFGNFFTNNVKDVDEHGPHTMMNLWEENIQGGFFELDGFFGSASHWTFLRSGILDSNMPVMFKRWTSNCNLVGNVLGNPGGTYNSFQSYTNGDAHMIMESGFPNIGNYGYIAVSQPIAYNFPLTEYPSVDEWGNLNKKPFMMITNNQTAVTNIVGTSTFPLPNYATNGLESEFYSLVWQDLVNTNLYYPTNGTIYIVSGTATSITVNQPVSLKSGQNLYLVGQSTYLQLQTNDLTTDTISGNYDYFHKAVTWNSGGAQTIPTSLLYTNGQPSWWGTNRWPAIDPLSSPMVAMIPAEYLYVHGRPQGVALTNANPVISVTPASQSFGTVAIGTPANQTFTVENTGGGTLTGSASVAAPFSIVSGGSYSLGAGQSQTVTVSYSPTVAGTGSQTITFSGGAGASVTINGTAVIPAPQNLQPHPPGS